MALLLAEIVLARWTAEESRVTAAALLIVSLPGTLYVLTFVGARQRQTDARLRAGEPLGDMRRMMSVLTAVVVLTGTIEAAHLVFG